jgi:multiple sugar transport system permease protein
MRVLRYLVVVLYFLVATAPLVWMGLSSLKHRDDSIRPHANFIPALSAPATPTDPRFEATLAAYRQLGEVHAGAQQSFWSHLGNSVLIGVLSTLASVVLGTCCAYGFSRFRVPGAKDWLFFILSTRFLPPLAVVVPVLIMYRTLDLQGTHVGLIVLYTVFNLSLAVWLMKGFLDDIPRAFEEAALVDGYSRAQAFVRVVLPEARTGMAVTAVFCLISAWNEYGFAMTLNSSGAITVPAYFAGLQGNIEGMPWPQIAAGALLFVAPIVVFTVLVRKNLLRGMTFGTIKQ